MTTTRTLTPLVAVTLGAVLLLTGCTGTNNNADPSPTSSSSTKSSTPTPTPSGYTPVGDPGGVGAPKSSNDAYVASNKTIKDFLAVQYEIQADTGANPDRIAPYATGQALTQVKQVAAGLAAKKITTKGAPVWTPDPSTTTFGSLTPSGSAKIANGIVYVRGCYDVSKQVPTYADGSPAPVSSDRIFPVQFNVQYVPADKSWKVNTLTSLSGQKGAPTC